MITIHVAVLILILMSTALAWFWAGRTAGKYTERRKIVKDGLGIAENMLEWMKKTSKQEIDIDLIMSEYLKSLKDI